MATAADHVIAAAASIPVRDTPPGSAHTEQLSTNAPLASAFGAQLEEPDRNRDFRWPTSVRDTIPGILTDAQAEGLYRGLTYPIIADYDWWLDPNGAPQSAVDRISAGYNLPIGPDQAIDQRRSTRRFIFDEHLEDALRAPAYGHYAFEKVYEVLQDGPAGVNGGWVAHLRKLAPLPPRVISEIRPARDGGLEYIRVPALDTARGASVMGLQALTGAKLTVDQLVFYAWDREGANWLGRSMLRSLYRPWFYKDQIVRVGAINIKRAGGVPYAEAGPNTTPQQMRELHQLAASFKVGENAGAALPHGAVLKFAMAAGGDGAVEFIRLMNEEMATDWLQTVRKLGQTPNGSRALGEVLAQDADSVERRAAGWFCNVFNRHVIEDDVEMNEGPGALYAPLLRYSPKGNPVDALAGALDNAQAAGALPANSQAAAAVRAAAGERQRSRQAARPAASTIPLPDRALHRQPNTDEIAASVDFATLEQAWTSVQDELVGHVTAGQQAQIDELHQQIVDAHGDLATLAAIAATPLAASVLADPARQLIRSGRDGAMQEARDQGADPTDPSLDDADQHVDQHAAAEAIVLAAALSEAASRRAVSVAAGGVLTPEEVADQVREHLNSLTDAFLRERLGGLATHAQNAGRRAVFAETPPDLVVASELLDENTCTNCSGIDGHQYPSLQDAEADYPTGGYIACLGRDRCRGTLIGRWE